MLVGIIRKYSCRGDRVWSFGIMWWVVSLRWRIRVMARGWVIRVRAGEITGCSIGSWKWKIRGRD